MEERGCDSILRFDKEMKEIFNGENPIRKAIMGYYGELVVANELKKLGFDNVIRKGNLTGYDLSIDNKKIEVRTSELKKERAFKKDMPAWGWKLQTNDRKGNPKEIKYDFIILVKLENDWHNYQLFMFSKDEIESMKLSYFSGYQTVARVIYFFFNCLDKAIEYDERRKGDKMITEQCIEFNRNPNKYKPDWNKLKSN